jgi:hypothetical protein
MVVCRNFALKRNPISDFVSAKYAR